MAAFGANPHQPTYIGGGNLWGEPGEMKKLKYTVELFNASGCLLDSHSFSVNEGDLHDADLNFAVQQAIAEWVLNSGDTIKISETA